jgi:hypothetical protein
MVAVKGSAEECGAAAGTAVIGEPPDYRANPNRREIPVCDAAPQIATKFLL